MTMEESPTQIKEESATEKILSGLNEAQLEAVHHGEGPLLIVAGAGTGKTSVITRRIAYLIVSKQAKPGEILALTFTEKAASEMEERVDLLVPYGFADVWISTFHSFGDRILREEALVLGLNPAFQVMSFPEQVIFFREHLFEFPLNYYRPLGDPTKYIEAVLMVISRARDEDVSPAEYSAHLERLEEKLRANPENEELAEIVQRESEIAQTYVRYQELKAQHGKIDFGDQIGLLLKLFREHPAILGRYRKRFKYILIDEFQDTNYAQSQVLNLLAAEHENITVCGDDDQAVYKFRGAAISNILHFIDIYPDAKQVVLTHNYRSHQAILDTARQLICYNNPDRLEVKNGIDKRLVGVKEESGIPPVHLHYETLTQETDAVAKLVEDKVGAGEYRYRDFAILVRSNNDADPFLRALNMREIPFQFSGSRGLYRQEEVSILISFLRILSNPADSVSLYHLAGSEVYHSDALDLTLISSYAKQKNLSLFWVMEHLAGITELEQISEVSRKKIHHLVSVLKHYIELSSSLPAGQLLYRFLQESGYLAQLMANRTIEADRKIQNIARFFTVIQKFGQVTQLDRVPQFVQYLSLLIDAGDDPGTVETDFDTDAVNVLTVHKAKGLEFPVVIMASLVSDRFPVRWRRDRIELPDELIKDILPSGNFHLQEERRLFYVGMTRAQNELYFTSARDYGGVRPRKVSLFVCEALDVLPAPKKIKVSAKERIEHFAPAHRSSSGQLAPVNPEEIINLSYYKIDDYLTCPLKYKYVHIVRVPVLQHHTVVYGRALHAAVQEYHRCKKNGNSVTLDSLYRVFESMWVNEGFLTREHEERRFQAGKETLAHFFAREEENENIPSIVEERFSFNLGNNRIVGRWDRIDLVDGQATIIDFKSSAVHTEKDAVRRTRESLQLSIYALAYYEIYGKMPDCVELHFLESGLVGRAVKTENDRVKTIAKIEQAAAGIRTRAYQANPSYLACRYCAYREICTEAVIR